MKKKTLIVSLLTASTMLMAGNYTRSNNIVTDHDTGLQWQDQAYTNAERMAYNQNIASAQVGKTQKWINAAPVCSNLNLDGSGWRLPTINELNSIVDTSYYNPATDPIFENSEPLGYWSSTTYTENTSQAMGIGFNSGGWHHCGKDGRIKFIRCVRPSDGTTAPAPTPTPAPTPGDNNPPVADAGPDMTVQVNTPATIIGKGTDSDGAVVKYQWTRKSDGSVWSNDEVLVFTPSGTRAKTFVLTVTDDEGAKDTDEMVLSVTNDSVTPPPPPPSTGNAAPTADAGPDATVQVNNPVTISGSGSIDSDGAIVSYRWTRNGSFYTNDETFEFTPSGTRPKTFELTVTDDDGATDTDEMILSVTNGPVPPPTTGNTPPTADAGPDQTVQVNTPATLDGSKSSDSDGDIVTYQWTRKSDGSIWSDQAIFDFTPSGTRTKTFVLTVTDDEGATDTDEMMLSVTR